MRIHIVQKGDILYDIAKKYNVDFEEIVSMNPQLSSPDMIMPGMKIRIPSESKQVRRDKEERKDSKMERPKTSKVDRKEVKVEREKEETGYERRPMAEDIADDYVERKYVRPEVPKHMEPLYPIRPDIPSSPNTNHQMKEEVLREEKNGKGNIMDRSGKMYDKGERMLPQTQYRPMQYSQPMQTAPAFMPPIYHQHGMYGCCCHCMQPMMTPPYNPSYWNGRGTYFNQNPYMRGMNDWERY